MLKTNFENFDFEHISKTIDFIEDYNSFKYPQKTSKLAFSKNAKNPNRSNNFENFYFELKKVIYLKK